MRGNLSPQPVRVFDRDIAGRSIPYVRVLSDSRALAEDYREKTRRFSRNGEALERNLKKRARKPARGAAKQVRVSSAGDGIVAHPLENLIGYRLRLAYNVQVQRFSSVGGSANIRPPQFAVLKLAYYQPGLKQTDLTNILNKKHANIVTLLDELEERDLIARVADREDRRSRLLHLTPKGKDLTKKLLERYKLLDRNLDKTLSPSRRRQLVKLLDAFCRLDPAPDIDGPGASRRPPSATRNRSKGRREGRA